MIRFSDQLQALLKPSPAWYVILFAMTLTLLGIKIISTVNESFAASQSIWAMISVVGMALCIFLHPRYLGMLAIPLLGLTVLILAVLIMPGVPTWLVHPRNGARGWINLGVMDFQPAEMAKIVFVLALARYLRYRENFRTLPGLLIPFVIMFIPVGLILKQPDLGSSLLFPPVLFVMLLAAGAKVRHLASLLGLGLLLVAANVAVIAFDPPVILPSGRIMPHPPATRWLHILKPHQEARIAASISQFKGDDRFSQTTGYQQEMAMMLTGAGEFAGLGNRSKVVLANNWLPERHNDMVFALIVNRWGLIGGVGTLLLYLAMFGVFLVTAGRSKDPFIRLTIVGFAGLLLTQATINIAVTIGLMPITGLTLPFISYGGSSLLATFIMVGIVINFALRPNAKLTRPSFEFDPPMDTI